jgi:hypothetical protein
MKNFRNLVRESRVEDSGFSSVAAATLKHKQNKEPMPKLKEENDTTEKTEMAETQLHFIHYAAEEILDYIDDGGEVEEWYQNKLSKVHSDMESLHSYIEGESRRTGMKEEVEELDELKISTLTRYGTKAMQSYGRNPEKDEKRLQGVQRARAKVQQKAMAKEEVSKTAEAPKMVRDRKTGEMYDPKKKFKELMDKPETKAVMNRLAKEEVEQIDELSKKTLSSYAKKATSSMRGVAASAEVTGSLDRDDPHYKKYSDRTLKRVAGVEKAVDRLAKEEVEQIDELSKKTLGNYIKSASHDVAAKGAATRQFAIDSSRQSGEQDYDGARKSMAKSDKTFSKSWKRRDNMAKAVDRLTKEDIQPLDEKNKPTNPELWSRAIAQAKSKFDVYPSAYANGWAAKWYKERGGGWRSVNEAEERGTEPFLKTSRKTEIVKSIAKKKSKPEKFESEPILSSTVTRNQ